MARFRIPNTTSEIILYFFLGFTGILFILVFNTSIWAGILVSVVIWGQATIGLVMKIQNDKNKELDPKSQIQIEEI